MNLPARLYARIAAFLSQRMPSIFMRIYLGVLLAGVLAVSIGWFSLQAINAYRFQHYRQQITDGVGYLLQAGWQRQPGETARQLWLSDVSRLLGIDIAEVRAETVRLNDRERQQLQSGLTLVRQDDGAQRPSSGNTQVLMAISDHPGHLLRARFGDFSEQQVRAVATLLLDDLAAYPQRSHERLAEIQQHVPWKMAIVPLEQAMLSPEQAASLWQREPILAFGDSAGGADLRVIAPLGDDQALVTQPIPLFNWLPVDLAATLTVLTLFLLGVMIYSLILPLERKVRQLQHMVRQVAAGNLSARVTDISHDEIGQLGSSFNHMTTHVQRLIEAQRELTRAISHELRTPIARIRFGIDMLADTDDAESRWEQQQAIDQDIGTLDSLIDEVLIYAKLEEGQSQMVFEKVYLDELVKNAVRESQVLAQGQKVRGETVPVDLCADAEPAYLQHVLRHLCHNAVRHAHQQVRISAGIEGDQVFICVEDDGEGIAESDRERIFEAFARLDSSRNRSSGGYGLGLSIAARVAYWFRGSLEVDDSPTLGGARFYLRWPQYRSLAWPHPDE